ncbi:Por secretion system C-terminal sorting domain-containing protein [Chryseolinea serpens]|uniref:Por secretion system C-terminal sorting domain-containing protein n=1 Tax=Chryseolinea serpens TaxID=947013 RepID=A0A1M5JTJ4_9BACT|nr:chitobiase/beta-hexosaminidase C-terminal domain-containing protein [Chryseolinea serpens]SHG43735.1 Por secretion system C-terminal sorting domain-containing protein [Chryseolinea serpens]
MIRITCLAAILFLMSRPGYCQWTPIGLQGKTVVALGANQTDGSIFAVADHALYKTSNNGTDWNVLQNGVDGLSILSMTIDIDNAIYLGTSSGVYVSNDGGQSFQSLNANLPSDFGLYPSVASICVLNDLLFIGTSAGIYKCEKGTYDWKSFNKNLAFDKANKIMVFYNDFLYLGTSVGMYSTSIREDNWQKIYDYETFDLAIIGNEIYAGVSQGCPPIVKSSDFGATWVNASPATGACFGYSIYSFGNSIWVGTYYSSGIYSIDNGANWSNMDIGTDASVTTLARRGTSLLAGTEYYKYNTGVGGVFIKSNVFENILETLPYPEFTAPPGEYVEPVSLEIHARDKSAKVYYTTDGTLPTTSSSLYSNAMSIDKTTLINAIAVNDKGEQSKINTGYYRVNSVTGVEKEARIEAEIFPNPCSTQLTVSFGTNNPKVNISILDNLGRVVYNHDASESSIAIDTKALNPGVYYLITKGNNQQNSQIFVKR